VPVADQAVEMVNEFPYLGRLCDIKTIIAKAVCVFGCPIIYLSAKGLFIRLLSWLPYSIVQSAGFLIIRLAAVCHLETFHHRCVSCIMGGVTRHQQ